MSRSVLFESVCLISLLLFIAACGEDAPLEFESPTPVPVLALSEVEPPIAGDLALAVTEEAVLPRPSYLGVGRRDPFRSIITASPKRPTGVNELPPLQRNRVSDLRLQGIIWGSYGPKAIVNTPDGKGYTVGIGTKVGFNHGVISEITPKKVVVEETVLNIFGEPKKRRTEMELHPQKEG